MLRRESLVMIPLSLVITDKEGVVIFASELFYKMFQTKEELIIGKKWSDNGIVLISQDGSIFKINDLHSNTLLWWKINDKRNKLWIKVSSDYLDSDNTELISSFTDVSSEISDYEKMSLMLKNANIGMWTWNLITGGLVINNKWAEIIGYNIDELGPLSIETWIKNSLPEDLDKSDREIERHIRGEVDTYSCEVRMKKKTGEIVDILDTGQIITWADDGRPEIMIGTHQDLTSIRKAEKELIQNLKMEKVIADIISIFSITMNFDEALNSSLKLIGNFSGASRVYYFTFNDDNQHMDNTHEWCADGVTPEIDNLKHMPNDLFPWWMASLKNNQIINIPDVSLLPENASMERQTLESQNIKSLIVLPVYAAGRLHGFVGFDDVTDTGSWAENDHALLKMFVNVISTSVEKYESENKIKVALNNLSNFFNTQSDYVVIMDYQGRIVKVNKTLKDKLGYTEDDLIGKSVLILHPDSVRRDAERILKDMLEKGRTDCPLPAITKNGKTVYVETTIKKGVWNGEGVYFANIKDVSDIKLSEEKFSKTFRNSPILSCLINYETKKIIDVNDVFMEKLGYSLEDIKSINARDVFGHLYSLLESKSVRSDTIKNLSTKIRLKNGSDIDSNVSVSHINIQDKECCLIMAEDTSELLRLLENLKIAKEKAEESDRLKSAFLATINHELRTPLTHIIGFSSMIPDITEDENIKEYGNYINKSGNDLLNIIEDIFQLALLEQSEVKVREELFSASTLYLEMKNLLKTTLNESGKSDTIDTKFRVSPEVVTRVVNTDKSKIMQVVTNLIRNAVKFTEKGSISLNMSFREDDYLSISVIDTGIGIPEDKMELLFQFFRQIDDSHTRKYDGVGIGLAISQKIAKAMNGSISVNSIKGEGSKFIFTVPTKRNNEEIVVHLDKDDYINLNNSINKEQSKTVLIAEDDVISLNMLESIMLGEGYKVFRASNGELAVEYVKDNNPNLILMDLNMPLMDGFEATKLIRKLGFQNPIIAFTAYTYEKDHQKALSAGCNGVITKPVSKQDLLNKISVLV